MVDLQDNEVWASDRMEANLALNQLSLNFYLSKK